MTHDRKTMVALSIAGSDSGGGAGIQADLKTFEALGVFGTTAVTCVTAQNPDEVTGIEALSPGMVAEQVRTVCHGFPVAAAKTGMLFSGEIIRAVAAVVQECGIPIVVVDPVMVATSGVKLLKDEAVKTLCTHLLPKATVLTPNLPEAEILCGHNIESVEGLKQAAREIGEKYGVACVVKGGHLECGMRNAECGTEERSVLDVLWDGVEVHVFSSSRVDTKETHGTGCTFSAALAALMAGGTPLVDAVAGAKGFVSDALKSARLVGSHSPLGWSSSGGTRV